MISPRPVLAALLILLGASLAPAAAPYPPSPVIAGIWFDWSTHRRHALGSDNWQLTWADDDHQCGAWGDGGGFGGNNWDGRVGLGYGRIEGDWDKKPVFENPEGTGWCVSASYNPGLRRYLLATEHTVSHSSVMSLFDAPEPWGPWTTVKYWTSKDRFGSSRPGSQLDWADNVFFFSFAPKWFSPDGRSFTLVFTGGGHGKNNDSLNNVRGTFELRKVPQIEGE